MLSRFAGAGKFTVLGLMSGTSLDGLDAALMRFERDGQGLKAWDLLAQGERPLSAELRRRLESVALGGALSAVAWGALHLDLSRVFADFVLDEFPLRADGSLADLAAFPGQTVHHDPDGAGFSLQIGSPAAFALLTGIDTVGEFRLPDVLLGGQGAPLVPLADALLHRHESEYRVLLNIGGIANLSILPPGRGVEGVLAWDCGPGNTLLDATCRLAGLGDCDLDGKLAATGTIHHGRLARWLGHPWFARKAPKSTGRELFGGSFLGPVELERELAEIGAADLLATLVELTVEALLGSLAGLPCEKVYVGGGGSRNEYLMKRLSEGLEPRGVCKVDILGLPAGIKEAADFALLALEAVAGGTVALPAVTGARRAATAGVFCPGGGRLWAGRSEGSAL